MVMSVQGPRPERETPAAVPDEDMYGQDSFPASDPPKNHEQRG
jgi:hypothetical protein